MFVIGTTEEVQLQLRVAAATVFSNGLRYFMEKSFLEVVEVRKLYTYAVRLSLYFHRVKKECKKNKEERGRYRSNVAKFVASIRCLQRSEVG